VVAKTEGLDSSAPYRDLVIGTLQAFERRDIEAILSRYSEKVVYRTYGVVDQAFIRKDLERYFTRWPMTQAELKGSVRVVDTKKPDEKKVLFSYDFSATSPNRSASATGSAANEWWVWETPNGLKVFGERPKITKGDTNSTDDFSQTLGTPGPPPVQTHQDNRPVYLVVAPARRGLYIRVQPDAKSAIVARLHQGDRVFVDEGRVRNNHPPSPVDWQKVRTMSGNTGWINADYIAPNR
jgi:hypothetical protein